MAKKQKHWMPQTIFVYEEEDGDEKYLVASYERDDAYGKEPRLVGTYQLVEVGEIVSKAVYTMRHSIFRLDPPNWRRRAESHEAREASNDRPIRTHPRGDEHDRRDEQRAGGG